MAFHYHPETDSLYIVLSDKPSVESLEVIDEHMVLDFDAEGRVVGIDVEDASKILNLPYLAKAGVLVTGPPKPPERSVPMAQNVAASSTSPLDVAIEEE